tara:strand:+ start:2537 stop:2710 length:174 start_codon:yes stop_codon:yes gene_type:complete
MLPLLQLKALDQGRQALKASVVRVFGVVTTIGVVKAFEHQARQRCIVGLLAAQQGRK